MLSVLIPTYNFSVFSLVKELHSQLLIENIPFEIICIDDGSLSDLNIENQKIVSFSHVSFTALKDNIGRSAIRNLLSQKAQFSWLLFLDADVYPTSKSFIKNYLNSLQKGCKVFCGGLRYDNNPEILQLLRYKYGKKHEEISLKNRQKNPEKYFFTSNFLISKNVFSSMLFDERLKDYGREDLLFSLMLQKNRHPICHIENEVFHLGVEDDVLFVEKTKKAMRNLLFLNKNYHFIKHKVPLLQLLSYFKKVRFSNYLAKKSNFFEQLAIRKTSVFFLNCLKISYLCKLDRNDG
ncbi:glycosyltransferase family 2 protein [Polaribacter tangerinus]|uniref:glycosyltransferase family 2 protein n=1 Tax=Polaribacter tangerinus TaxID=1920034 RepID=UPI000B4C0519|nr:glycosyltransferase [Polaribacter tangerinus]